MIEETDEAWNLLDCEMKSRLIISVVGGGSVIVVFAEVMCLDRGMKQFAVRLRAEIVLVKKFASFNFKNPIYNDQNAIICCVINSKQVGKQLQWGMVTSPTENRLFRQQ